MSSDEDKSVPDPPKKPDELGETSVSPMESTQTDPDSVPETTLEPEEKASEPAPPEPTLEPEEEASEPAPSEPTLEPEEEASEPAPPEPTLGPEEKASDPAPPEPVLVTVASWPFWRWWLLAAGVLSLVALGLSISWEAFQNQGLFYEQGGGMSLTSRLWGQGAILLLGLAFFAPVFIGRLWGRQVLQTPSSTPANEKPVQEAPKEEPQPEPEQEIEPVEKVAREEPPKPQSSSQMSWGIVAGVLALLVVAALIVTIVGSGGGSGISTGEGSFWESKKKYLLVIPFLLFTGGLWWSYIRHKNQPENPLQPQKKIGFWNPLPIILAFLLIGSVWFALKHWAGYKPRQIQQERTIEQQAVVFHEGGRQRHIRMFTDEWKDAFAAWGKGTPMKGFESLQKLGFRAGERSDQTAVQEEARKRFINTQLGYQGYDPLD